jgi:transporter family-2 protein
MAVLTGVMIAEQSRANSELSIRIGNSVEAAFVSFTSGLIIIAIITLFSPAIKLGLKNLRRAVKSGEMGRWRLLAGALGGAAIAISTHVVPLIGVALYSVATISGQTAVSLLVDRIGLGGGERKLISLRRVIAAVITVLAVFVSVLDRISIDNFQLLAVILGLAAGVIIGVQRSLNGSINLHSQASYATSLLNFIMGSSFLALLTLALLIFRGDGINSLPSGPWWIYTGGVVGVIYIAMSSLIVQHLGVLTFVLFSVGGQLLGSLIFDALLPTEGAHVTTYLITGIVMTYIGVVVGGESRLFKRSSSQH